MKILINALSARLGGGQTYIKNLVRFLPQETTDDIFLLVPDSLEIPSTTANLTRIPVRWPLENPVLRAIWERTRLPRLLDQLKADVLFCPGGMIGASNFRGCKTVTMFRNMLPFDAEQCRRYPFGRSRIRHWLLKRFLLGSMKKADLVIFVSDFAKRVVEEQTGGQLKHAVTIPHGVSPSFRASTNGDLLQDTWPELGEYFLYASAIDFYKAQMEVVQAYALLKQRRATTEKLLLVGPEFKDYGKKVRKEIERLGLQQDVLLTGSVPYEQMSALYHNAKVNIFASECENCPNALLEALAAGRPTIVSKCDPMPEFAADAAVYFDPRSSEQLADVIEKVLSDPALMADLSSRALERSMMYDWQITAKNTWHAITQLNYDSLLAENREKRGDVRAAASL